MTTLSLTFGQPSLADRVVPRGLVTDLSLIAAGAALTGIAAQIAVPLWPVPITGQTLAVLLVGSSLGALRGALSMLLYMAAGALGLPVFSDMSSGLGVMAGPTGGYILGFVVAAALTGWLAQRSWDTRLLGGLVSFTAGTVVIFALGMAWLSVSMGLSPELTLRYGLYPFILGGLVKALLAAGLVRLAWGAVQRADARRERGHRR